MEPQYDLEAWAGETTAGRRTFNRGFRMFGSEVPGWSLASAAPMQRSDELSETTYLWQSRLAPERELVSVNVAELPGWRDAHEHLRLMLSHSMRGELPRAGGLHSALGDVAFIGPAPDSGLIAAVMFVRGNVAVAINSAGSATVDVTPFADLVDRMLGEDDPGSWPGLRASGRVMQVDAAGAMPLILRPGGTDKSWLKVIAPDGELRWTGEGLVYTAAATGTKSVRVIEIVEADSGEEPERSNGAPGGGRLIAMVIAAAALLAVLYLLARAAGLAGSP